MAKVTFENSKGVDDATYHAHFGDWQGKGDTYYRPVRGAVDTNKDGWYLELKGSDEEHYTDADTFDVTHLTMDLDYDHIMMSENDLEKLVGLINEDGRHDCEHDESKNQVKCSKKLNEDFATSYPELVFKAGNEEEGFDFHLMPEYYVGPDASDPTKNLLKIQAYGIENVWTLGKDFLAEAAYSVSADSDTVEFHLKKASKEFFGTPAAYGMK